MLFTLTYGHISWQPPVGAAQKCCYRAAYGTFFFFPTRACKLRHILSQRCQVHRRLTSESSRKEGKFTLRGLALILLTSVWGHILAHTCAATKAVCHHGKSLQIWFGVNLQSKIWLVTFFFFFLEDYREVMWGRRACWCKRLSVSFWNPWRERRCLKATVKRLISASLGFQG